SIARRAESWTATSLIDIVPLSEWRMPTSTTGWSSSPVSSGDSDPSSVAAPAEEVDPPSSSPHAVRRRRNAARTATRVRQFFECNTHDSCVVRLGCGGTLRALHFVRIARMRRDRERVLVEICSTAYSGNEHPSRGTARWKRSCYFGRYMRREGEGWPITGDA